MSKKESEKNSQTLKYLCGLTKGSMVLYHSNFIDDKEVLTILKEDLKRIYNESPATGLHVYWAVEDWVKNCRGAASTVTSVPFLTDDWRRRTIWEGERWIYNEFVLQKPENVKQDVTTVKLKGNIKATVDGGRCFLQYDISVSNAILSEINSFITSHIQCYHFNTEYAENVKQALKNSEIKI